jgi:hypothetical protein
VGPKTAAPPAGEFMSPMRRSSRLATATPFKK